MSDLLNQIKMSSIQKVHQQRQSTPSSNNDSSSSSFADIISEKIKANSEIEFSKHALSRVVTRDVDLSAQQIERLNHGATLARSKGLNNSLILVDQIAFVVNLNQNKVITTLNDQGLKNQVFTNIDGAVIV